MNLRSPFLSKMPPTDIRLSARVGRISKRLIIGVPIFLLGIILVTAVRQEWLAKDGPWRILYAIHDNVYLLVKGYSFTLFFPESLIFWGLVATILVLILVSQLTDRSLIKEPHIQLLRGCMYRPALHPVIIRGSQLLRRLKIEPKLIKLVAHREWEKAMLSLSQNELASAPQKPCRQLITLTRFNLQLSQHFPNYPNAVQSSLWRLEKWHTTYLTIHAYGNQQKRWYPKLIQNLFKMFSLINLSPSGTWNKIPTVNELFDPSELMREVEILKELGYTHLLKETSLDFSFIELTGMLASVVEARRWEIMDKAVFYLEKQLGEMMPSTAAAAFPKLLNDSQTLPIGGRIALSVALHVALFTTEPDIALAYIESVEALAFLLNADVVPQKHTAQLKSLMEEEVSLPNGKVIRHLPLDHAYSLLGQLLAKKTKVQEEHWQPIWRGQDSPIIKQDFDLAYDIVASLHQASGFPGEMPDK